jgi:hypothetical protein
MCPEEILLSDLPQKPSVEVAIRAHGSGIDIPPVCFTCLAVMDCPPSKIGVADGKTLRLQSTDGVKASDICPEFKIQK